MVTEFFEEGFLLHKHPYRETSAMLDLFTRESGVRRAIIRGVNGKTNLKKSKIYEFCPFSFRWTGKYRIAFLNSFESIGPPLLFKGRMIYNALYVNELVLRSCAQGDPYPILFDAYVDCLNALHVCADPNSILRAFEFTLLSELGYGINFEAVEHSKRYQFYPGQGFSENADHEGGIPGHVLMDIRDGHYKDHITSQKAKNICRAAIEHVIGGRHLGARTLYHNKKRLEGV